MGKELQQRRNSLRLYGYDYSQSGAYYVTLVTHNRYLLFGSIHDENVQLSLAGQIVYHEWKSLSSKFPYIDLDSFVVMPNHIHGIIVITDSAGPNQISSMLTDIPKGTTPKSLSAIIQNFKSVSSKRIRASEKYCPAQIWETSFHDRIIRNVKEYEKIKAYIENNPSRWNEDENYLI